MKTVGDVLELIYGKALKAEDRAGGQVPVVGSGGIVGHHAVGITEGPTIVVGRKGSIGSVTWIDGPAWPIDTAYYIRAKDSDLAPRWVYWMLRSLPLVDMNKSAAVPGLNRDDVYRLPLRVPSASEQRRIAAILDRADAIRAKRRQVLARLDSLTQAVFHDVFGDPRGDRWERIPFGELVPRVDSGTSPNCESRPADGDEWGVLKLGAVTYGRFQPEQNKAYLGGVQGMAANEVREGDVLMTRKNTRELVGAVALVGEVRPRLLLPDLIFRLHLEPALVNRRYFQALMMNKRKRPAIQDLASGSASSMPNISKARLMRLPIEVPPLPRQREFSSRVERIERQRAAAERICVQDDELFASLQSRAFRGEL